MKAITVAVLSFKASAEDVSKYSPDHDEWLFDGFKADKFIAAGRQVSAHGGVILVRGGDLAIIESMMSTDPFIRHGVAELQLIPFQPHMLTAGLEY